MTQIKPIAGFSAVSIAAPRPRAGGCGFTMGAADGALLPTVTPAGEIGETQTGLLALQADPESADSAARRRGRGLLAGLAALQRGLLRGDDESPVLRTLDAETRQVPRPDDPRLRDALDEIVLRVRVELARRETDLAVPVTAPTPPE